MNLNDQQELIELARECTWKTQDRLRQEEHAFIDNACVFVQSTYTDDFKRYLALGSIPHIVDMDLDLAEQEGREKLQILWKQSGMFELLYDRSPLFAGRPTLPIGNLRASFLIIGDAPGQGKLVPIHNEFDRTLAYGPSSHMLRKALLSNGLYYDCWFTNLCKLSIRENAPSNAEQRALHKSILDQELALLVPERIITLGTHVHEAFIAMYDARYVFKVPHPAWAHRTNMTPQAYGQMIKERLHA